MYGLKLDSKRCISCGICMDVCSINAMAMHTHASSRIEGMTLLHLHFPECQERQPVEMMTFPYLANPLRCDGCLQCVNECPVRALELLNEYVN